jgi:hypothetical protein
MTEVRIPAVSKCFLHSPIRNVFAGQWNFLQNLRGLENKTKLTACLLETRWSIYMQLYLYCLTHFLFIAPFNMGKFPFIISMV